VTRVALLLAVAAALLVVGCGDDASEAETTTATVPAETSIAKVYFLRDGKVWPVAREIAEDGDAAVQILAELYEGPTEDEEELGFGSALSRNEESVEISTLTVSGGRATYRAPRVLTQEGLAQVVYSLTQLDPVVKSVEIDGTRYTRADFEDQTPSVLVESPLPFEEVESPLRATGTANTFEATFNYELTDTDGLIVDENFVTATSGTGQRGTFDFTTDKYEIPFDGIGELIVFERSAEDGSKIHLVEIPLRMSK
jgi:germination protein M